MSIELTAKNFAVALAAAVRAAVNAALRANTAISRPVFGEGMEAKIALEVESKLSQVFAEVDTLRSKLRAAETALEEARKRAELLQDHYDCKMAHPERVSTLEAELAEARKDGERLDWMEKNGSGPALNKNGLFMQIVRNGTEASGNISVFTHKTVREVIDQARAASKGAGE